MFRGTYEHRVNSKGQVAVPARFRTLAEQRGEGRGLYLVNATGYCLYMFTQGGLDRVAPLLYAGVAARAGERMSAADFRLRFNSEVKPLDPDPQGRIRLPGDLKEAAGVGRDVVFVGNDDRIELWSAERWSWFRKEGSESLRRQRAEAETDPFRRLLAEAADVFEESSRRAGGVMPLGAEAKGGRDGGDR